jgi:excisionase family DNA binding protein
VTDRLTMSIEEAARALGVSRGLAYELARTGGLPVLRLGRRIVVPRAQLEAMVAGQDWRPAAGEES